jgi:prepilin-type N-terminal cleavage/methylation domain-containing protein
MEATLRMSRRSPRPRLHGFTLVELLLAVVILLVVILAVGRIFSTASTLTAYGEATNDLLQEATAIERRIRQDLSRISRDGFLAIQNIEVRNDVNGAANLLDPALPANATFRADRMIFIADGVSATSRFLDSQQIGSGGANDTPFGIGSQAPAARVYYGHGLQLPNAPPLTDAAFFEDDQPLAPWSRSDPFNQGTWLGTSRWPAGTAAQPIVATPLPPRRWAVVRQPVLLTDRGGLNPLNYGGIERDSARSIWPEFNGGPQDRGSIRKGRVDIATQTPAAIRRVVETVIDPVASNGLDPAYPQTPPANYRPLRPWHSSTGVGTGQQIIARTFAYPRVESRLATSDRQEQMLANSLFAANVSSFIIEWTYADGAGRQVARPEQRNATEWAICNAALCLGTDCLPPEPRFLAGIDLRSGPGGFPVGGDPTNPGNWRCMQGVAVDRVRPERWFGLAPRSVATAPQAIANPAATIPFALYASIFPTLPIYAENIEGAKPQEIPEVGPPGDPRVRTYQAAFGYNREQAFIETGPGAAGRWMSPDLAYTPLPTAIRITMTLHDSRGTLQEGRTFQFIVPLAEQP